MSPGLNKVMLIGRVGRQPELRHTASGRPVASFSLGTSRSWESSERERHSEVEWFTIVAWGSLAETCYAQLAPDQQVFVEGRLKHRQWDDAQGVRHSATEVEASEVMLLGEPSNTGHLARARQTISDYGA